MTFSQNGNIGVISQSERVDECSRNHESMRDGADDDFACKKVIENTASR